MARTSEVLNARWEEFDIDERLWEVPKERMKMDEPHKVALSSRAIEILELAKQFNDAELVFPSSRKSGTALSNMSLLMLVRRLSYDNLTVHGFRATFKTWAEEKTRFDSLVVEASMAHQVKGIERHYLRTTFFDQRKDLMERWAAFATATPAQIVKMRGA